MSKELSAERKRFSNRGFGVVAYSRAYSVKHSLLSNVLDGKYDGTRANGSGEVRKIMKQLKKDGVIRGRLPWEK